MNQAAAHKSALSEKLFFETVLTRWVNFQLWDLKARCLIAQDDEGLWTDLKSYRLELTQATAARSADSEELE